MPARAPYNFVPLPDKVMSVKIEQDAPDHDRYHEGRLSGYFDVMLTTESPLYIRGPEKLETYGSQDQKPTVEFFHHGDKNQPVIPGSSLRGMLRSLLEIITWGKMSPVSEWQLMYRAVGDTTSLGSAYRGKLLKQVKSLYFEYPSPRVRGGYLRQNGSHWEIVPAKKYLNESFVLVTKDSIQKADINIHDFQRVHAVHVKPTSRSEHRKNNLTKNNLTLKGPFTDQISLRSQSDFVPATLVISGRAPNRRWHAAIFEQDETAAPIVIPDVVWKTYVADRDLKRGIPTRKLENGDPLFYLVDDKENLVFFGPTMMFRLPYDQRVVDLISDLRDPKTFDWAEALFGHVQQEKKGEQGNKSQSYAGRVFVEDAFLTPGQTDLFEQPVWLRILSGPKPTTFQHYLEQPKGTDTEKKDLYHYATRNVKIRGHKLYWRQRGTIATAREPENVGDNDTQHTRVRAVKAGKTFQFRVRFENLTEAELGALAWAIALPNGDKLRHMLGMGKPLGMGVVKLEPTLYLIDRQQRYQTLFDGDAWQQGLKQEAINSYVDAFYAHVRQHLDKDFLKHDRIEQLLVMLEGRPYDSDNLGYMTIEPLNEFKPRHVLPKPTEVVKVLPPPVQDNTPKPKPPFDVKEGDVLRGKVTSVDTSMIFVQFNGDEEEKFEGIIYKSDLAGKQYQKDVDITVKVLEVERKRDPIEVRCRPATKEERKK